NRLLLWRQRPRFPNAWPRLRALRKHPPTHLRSCGCRNAPKPPELQSLPTPHRRIGYNSLAFARYSEKRAERQEGCCESFCDPTKNRLDWSWADGPPDGHEPAESRPHVDRLEPHGLARAGIARGGCEAGKDAAGSSGRGGDSADDGERSSGVGGGAVGPRREKRRSAWGFASRQ